MDEITKAIYIGLLNNNSVDRMEEISLGTMAFCKSTFELPIDGHELITTTIYKRQKKLVEFLARHKYDRS